MSVMKKVVLFKSPSEDYEKAFRENNFEAIFIEPLQFKYMNLDELNKKLLQDDYHGLIITSPRATEAISKCWDPTKFVIWNKKRVYTVGDTSSHKIMYLLGLEAMGATSGNAENLAKIILQENSAPSKFLFPCGNLSSETLPDRLKAGVTMDTLTVYETTENKDLRTKLMEVSNHSENIPCCMVFFSPSGCEYIHRQLQTFNNRISFLPHFAIGNSTAHKIENLGLEIAGVAAKPSAESVVEAIQAYFNNLPTCN